MASVGNYTNLKPLDNREKQLKKIVLWKVIVAFFSTTIQLKSCYFLMISVVYEYLTITDKTIIPSEANCHDNNSEIVIYFLRDNFRFYVEEKFIWKLLFLKNQSTYVPFPVNIIPYEELITTLSLTILICNVQLEVCLQFEIPTYS